MAEEKKETSSVSAEASTTKESQEAKQPEEVKKPEEAKKAEEIKKSKETKKPEEKKKPEKKVVVPEKFKKLVEEIENLSLLDLAELVKILEKRFGISPASSVGVGAPAGVAGAAPTAAEAQAEEKTEFNIELKEVGSKKIEVIKAVRDVTEKGLKESKDLVDAAASGPQVIKENVKKEEAEEIKKKFEAAGAKVELK